MTNEQFERLSESEQLTVLIRNGELLRDQFENGFRVFLYQVEHFYVKVKYCVQTDEMISMNSFCRLDMEDRINWKILKVFCASRNEFES